MLIKPGLIVIGLLLLSIPAQPHTVVNPEPEVNHYVFTADTDRNTASVVPVPLVAPVGSGLVFVATGLLMLIGLRRKVRG